MPRGTTLRLRLGSERGGTSRVRVGVPTSSLDKKYSMSVAIWYKSSVEILSENRILVKSV